MDPSTLQTTMAVALGLIAGASGLLSAPVTSRPENTSRRRLRKLLAKAEKLRMRGLLVFQVSKKDFDLIVSNVEQDIAGPVLFGGCVVCPPNWFALRKIPKKRQGQIWQPKDQPALHVSLMTDRHLENSINLLLRYGHTAYSNRTLRWLLEERNERATLRNKPEDEEDFVHGYYNDDDDDYEDEDDFRDF